MMNVLALSLVLTTLITAGVFTPSPENKKIHGDDDVIVKDGHRRVVVEYDTEDRSNTRVFISPEDHVAAAERVDQKSAGVDQGVTGKVKEAASEYLQDMGEGISAPDTDKYGHGRHRASPRELVCDAYGKCKHKMASAIGRTKEKFSDKASEAAEKVHEVEEEVKEDVREAFDKVKEKTHGVSDKAHEAKEKVREVGSGISGKAKEAKETVKERAKQEAERVKHGVEDLVDTGKTLKGHVESNASRSMEKTKNKVSEKRQEAEEILERASKESKKGLKQILSYLISPERMAGILQLLGTSTGLGASIWVTFGSSYILARALPRQQFAIVQSKIYPVYFKAMAYSIGAVLIGHLLSQRKIRSSSLSSGSQEIIQTFNLLSSLIIELINLLILEPRATKIVFDRMKLEKEGGGRGKESSRATDQPSGRIIDSLIEPAVSREAAEGREHQPTTKTTTRTPATTAVRQEEEMPAAEEDAASKAEMIRLSKRLKKLNSISSFLNILTVMALTWHLVHLGRTIHCVC